jgi:phage protein U
MLEQIPREVPTGLAKIGNIIFEARDIPFSKLHIEKKTSWVEHKTLKGGFIVNFTGKSARKIEIGGTLLPDFHKGVLKLDELDKHCDAGNPLPLTISTKYFGLWAITGLHEERSIFDSKGAAKKIDFRLELLEVSNARN